MTSKDLSIFNSLRPFSIGFDDMFDQFENSLEMEVWACNQTIRHTTSEELDKTNTL